MDQAGQKVIHGALDYEEIERLGLHPDDILDFSVNTNPYGPSPHVREALAHLAFDRYPDRECLQLRRTILHYELTGTNLPLSSIMCGNGTSELIWAIAHTLLQPGQKTSIVGPTYGDYHAASRATRAMIVEKQAQAQDQFQLDREALIAWVMAERPLVLWLCNPNNPTGTWLDQHDLQHLLAVCAEIGTALVVDEAYWHFLVPHEPFSAIELLAQQRGAPLLVLRSLTKAYALAGVRLGYVVGPPDLIASIRVHLPSWNVSSFAQAAGVAALTDQAYLRKTLHEVAVQRSDLFQALRNLGLQVMPSRTHFCLVKVNDARELRLQLLIRNILVRDCTSFGLPSFMRIATRKREDWQQLVSALQEVL